MSKEEKNPFVEGLEVVVNANRSHYDEGSYRFDRVRKVHKNGNFTLESDPKRQWRSAFSSFGDVPGWYAYPVTTERFVVRSSAVYPKTPRAISVMEAASARAAHQGRCKKIATYFGDPKKVSQDVSAQVMDIIVNAGGGGE